MGDTLPTVATPPTAPQAVAKAPVPNVDSANPSPKLSAPADFGGLRGGRARDDGLLPGSAEAKEADRVKDAKRKRDARASKRTDPPPLSPVHPGAANPANPAPTPPPDLAGVPGAPAPLWLPSDLQPLINHGLPLAEAVRTHSHLKKLMDAGIPAGVIEEIARDLKWDEAAKTSLKGTLPATAAKIANALRLPTTFKEEISSLPALAMILWAEHKRQERIDKLIAEHKQSNPTPATAAKK